METTSSCATLITFDVSWHRPPLLCCMNAQEQKQQQLPSNCIFKMGSVSPAKEISVRIQISKDKGGHLRTSCRNIFRAIDLPTGGRLVGSQN